MVPAVVAMVLEFYLLKISKLHVCCAVGMTGFSGAKSAERESKFGSGNSNFLLENVECVGNETSIDHCSSNGWGNQDCGSSEVAGVVCVGWSNE